MTILYKQNKTEVGTVPSQVYAVSTNHTAIINAANAVNHSADDRVLSVHILESGASELPTNAILINEPVVAGETVILDKLIGHSIPDGGRLTVLSDGDSAVNLFSTIADVF